MATFSAVEKSGDKKGIPTQNGIPSVYGYVPAAGYTPAPSALPIHPAYAGYPSGAAYPYPQGPPPPYSVAVSQPCTVPGYPTYASFGYPYCTPVYSQAGILPAPTTIIMPGAFDAGARFDGIARSGVPPPPPGVMPNAAQLAMMQGQTPIVTQQKGNFLTGGSDGGYTFW